MTSTHGPAGRQRHPAADTIPQREPEESTLYRFTDQLFRARTIEQVYEAGLSAICEALSAPKASILSFDAAGVLRFVAWRGLSEAYRQAVEGHSPWARHERDADPIFVHDVSRSGLPAELIEIVHREGIRSLGFVPIADSDELLGKFMVYYDAPRAFDEHERRIALIISRQLGFAFDRFASDVAARRLMALVESSDDAIVAKNLNSIVTDWNPAAERLFGYRRDEIIGKSITLLIPADRQFEEPEILRRIRQGERIEHFETIRQRKDGSLFHVSLTVSPIKDATGTIVGASKIARDISGWRQVQDQRELLLREMHHRVKNLFAVVGGILSLSARSVANPADLASVVSERFATLARAHDLTMSISSDGTQPAITLHRLVSTILSPYRRDDRDCFEISGEDPMIPPALVTPISLLLHEFATNAAKYGCLSTIDGHIVISCEKDDQGLLIRWQEKNGPPVLEPDHQGFGTRLINATARQLGQVTYRWDQAGVIIDLTIDNDKLGA